MGRSRSRSVSRKKSRRRSKHRTLDRKSSKYRTHPRSASSSDSSSSRYKSSSKYQNKRHRRRDSRSPSTYRTRHRKQSTSSSDSSSRSSTSTELKKTSSYIDRIRAIRTPTPPKLNFEASMEFLDKRQVSDALDDINKNEFRPKTFSSAKKSEIVDIIKIKGETKATKLDSTDDDPLFHQKVKLFQIAALT